MINRHWFDPKVWNRAVAGAGFERSRATGLHALRHFYASTQLEAGVSIKALAEYLGHSDPGFTLRVYTHLLPSSETRARQAVDELFQGAWEIGPTDPGRPTDGPEAGE